MGNLKIRKLSLVLFKVMSVKDILIGFFKTDMLVSCPVIFPLFYLPIADITIITVTEKYKCMKNREHQRKIKEKLS